MNKANQQSGFALLLTLIVVAVVLAVGLTILEISNKTLALSTNAKESEIAFHAANAGLECIRYWKEHADTNDDDLNDFNVGDGDISISCFGVTGSSVTPNATDFVVADISGNVYAYQFNLDYGSPVRCSQMSLVVMESPDATSIASFDQTVPTEAFPWDDQQGVGGYKRCDPYSVCSIAYVRGYNTSCTNVNNSTYGQYLQREILLEF